MESREWYQEGGLHSHHHAAVSVVGLGLALVSPLKKLNKICTFLHEGKYEEIDKF